MFNKIISLLYPKSCVICKKEHNYLCSFCESKIKRNLSNETNLKIFYLYDYENYIFKKIKTLIKWYSYRDLCTELGSYSIEYIKDNIKDFDEFILIPIPISKNKLNKRGYNQAEEIAKGIAKNGNKIYNLLARKKNTHKLYSEESVDARMFEIQNSMEISDIKLIEELKDKKILIVDDIVTTGSTFMEARNVLVKYGINRDNIYFYALAR